MLGVRGEGKVGTQKKKKKKLILNFFLPSDFLIF